MWELYGKWGVAIKIKANSLNDLLHKFYADEDDNMKLLYGFCNYLKIKEFDYDYMVEVIKSEIAMSKAFAFNKDISFKHEKEFRYAIYFPLNENAPEIAGFPLFPLIDIFKEVEIIAHPKTNQFQLDMLQRLIYCFIGDKPLKKSVFVS